MTLPKRDDVSPGALNRGFEAGNYAAQYESRDLTVEEPREFSAEWAGHEDYRTGFILGFFSSYEPHEIPREQYERWAEALLSPGGQECVYQGFIDLDELAGVARARPQIETPAACVQPCDCGSTDPSWHGPPEGRREFCCDDCWRSRHKRIQETINDARWGRGNWG